MPSPLPQLRTPDAPSALQVLVERFSAVPDYRCGNANQIHRLVDVLVTSICAVLGGANSWLSVARFVATHETWFRTFLALPGGIPSHDTYRQIFLRLAPQELNQRFATWLKDISQHVKPQQIAFDGKTPCGSGNGRTGLPALHMAHAFAVGQGICLAQQAVDVKPNEITAIPELLKLLNLKGALVTIDAIGCQKEMAAGIVAAEGDYVLAAKGNRGRLHDDVRATMASALQNPTAAKEVTLAQTQEDNRGRGEKRTCYVTTELSAIRDSKLWKGLKAVGVIVSERAVAGKVEVEKRYYICSRVLAAHELLRSVRNHWGVENGLHWVLDVVFGEDSHQLRVGHGAANFTTLRKLAHALIKNRQSKHGIKGSREMAGWDTNILEKIIHDAAIPQQ